MLGRTPPTPLLVLLLFLSAGAAFGQPLEWAVRAGGLSADDGVAIAVDGTGRSCVTGELWGTATFGAGEPNETVLTSVGESDVFVARYDVSGSLMWARRGGGESFEFGEGIAVDGAGDCYLAGSFVGVATFGLGEPNETRLVSAGFEDLFIAKYDGSGLLVWAKRAGGTLPAIGTALAGDGAGNSLVTGEFSGTVTFGPGEPNGTVLTSVGVQDIFVARYDGSGSLVWVVQADATDGIWSEGVAVDQDGHAYLTGHFGGTATFGAGEPNQTVLTAGLIDDVFVAELDASGSLEWAVGAGGTLLEAGRQIAVDALGQSLVSGDFRGTATFGAGGPNEKVLTSAGRSDLFVARYDGSGLLLWATAAGGTESDRALGVAAGDSDHCYVTGVFEDTATFGAGEPNQAVLTSTGGSMLYLAEYGPAGRLISVTQAVGADPVWGVGLASDGSHKSYLTGFFFGEATFGAGEPNETALVSESESDAFVAGFASVTVFADGFESADASRWSAAAP